ncbi:hypothetical protein [Mammaliicoccus sciuri]|uniref:hypothetical protein n=1 Tax=Mammaliicoccus sciuri TaxID=1296 RepID=UPI0037ABAD86
MKLNKMDHVGIIVEDLESVKAFFTTLGLELIGEQNIEQVVEQLATTSSQVIGEITQFEDIYKLCYIKGPEGIYIELAEKLK